MLAETHPTPLPADLPVRRWLDAEMDRVWLLAERCLRSQQAAGLRPPAGHPDVADVEGMLAQRSGRAANRSIAEIERELSTAESGLSRLRAAAPIGRLIRNMPLQPIEVELLTTALAPHIDSPLAELFGVIQRSYTRRGVDLALVAQLHDF